MSEARQYQIISLLWLILASTGNADHWMGLVSSGFALCLAIAYVAAFIWVTWRGSKEGRDASTKAD